MAMSKRPPESQETLWVETAALRQSPGHPFYEKLNELLQTHGFGAFVGIETIPGVRVERGLLESNQGVRSP